MTQGLPIAITNLIESLTVGLQTNKYIDKEQQTNFTQKYTERMFARDISKCWKYLLMWRLFTKILSYQYYDYDYVLWIKTQFHIVHFFKTTVKRFVFLPLNLKGTRSETRGWMPTDISEIKPEEEFFQS